jgi:hypothetical protein
VQHRVDALDEVAGVGRGRPFLGVSANSGFHSVILVFSSCLFLHFLVAEWMAGGRPLLRELLVYLLLILGEGGNRPLLTISEAL